MSKGGAVVECKVCQQHIPAAFKNTHHERPQAAGGGKEDEVELCVGCHQQLHAIANLLKANRGSEAEDAAKIAYPDGGTRERLFKLAWAVVEWMRLKEDGKLSLDEDVVVEVVLPAEVKVALTQMAKEVKHKGRRMGVSNFCSEIIKKEVYERYPSLKKSNPDEEALSQHRPRAKRPSLPRSNPKKGRKRG